MKFKHFSEKITEGEIDPIDLMIHYVSICDHMVDDALTSKNWDLALAGLDKIQEVSDRLISVTYGILGEEDGPEPEEGPRNPIGFQQHAQIERVDEEDSEHGGLQ